MKHFWEVGRTSIKKNIYVLGFSGGAQVKCLKCGHVSERREKYRDLVVQVAGQEDLVSLNV